MKKTYLLPNCFKTVGRVLVGLCALWLALGAFTPLDLNFEYRTLSLFGAFEFGNVESEAASPWFCTTSTSFGLTIFPVLLFVGLIFIAFSRNKIEDELIGRIREQSFVWAMLVGTLVVVAATLLLYGFAYLYFTFYDAHLFLVLFLLKFDYEIYKLKKSVGDDK